MREIDVVNDNLRHALAAFSRIGKTGAIQPAGNLSLVYAGVPYALFNTALLMERVPKAEWIDFGHRLVLHGRYTCLARDPQCGTCSLRGLCPVGLGEPDPYRGAGGDVTLDRVTTKDAGSTSIAPSPSPAPTPGRRKAAGRPRKGSAGGKGQP